jgi:disulfide bond formation protein DsbB
MMRLMCIPDPLRVPFFKHYTAPRRVVVVAGLLSAFYLTFALVSQYGFGLFPCELCLAQRVPYAVMLLLMLAALLTRKGAARMVAACVLLFWVDAGIAFYHTAVELRWVAGPSACTASTEPQTLEAMRAAIMNAALVSCDQPMVHVLGLSMAAWNGVAALFSGIFILWLSRWRRA